MSIEVRSAAFAPSLRPHPPCRAEGGAEATPTMFGHFATFNEWTEIDSAFEGNFLERVAPGAFARSLARDRSRLRVLFQHGRDPQIGDKVLGIPTVLREDELGAAYEVPLLDTSYVRDLIPGLEAGAYGASFRFKVVREDLNQKPERSTYNPDALPERTIREARVMEFGPVTFPAYEGATAGVRSLTDWWLEAA
jgi:HK97 family phage prohead protease